MRVLLAALFCASVLLSGCGGGGGDAGGGGGNASTPNPIPSISSLSPASATEGSSAFTLTVNGTNFIAGSMVEWNGSSRTTTYVSASQLTASITAADLGNSGTIPVTVVNPAPGGGTSAVANIPVNNPSPSLASVAPAAVVAGGSAFTLTITGSNFSPNSSVLWNGSSRTTTYMSATQLSASITAADIATSGAAAVTVSSPAPGGGATSATNVIVADVLADASSVGSAMVKNQLGANVNIGFLDDTNSAFIPIYQGLGVGLFRYPGGELADYYHWQSNSVGTCSPFGPGKRSHQLV